MAAANRDDDPTTWFPVAKVPAATSGTTAPAANDDPTTWFPVGTVKEKPPPGGGVIRNIGAGSAEGGAGGINFMSDPVGSLGQMALTAGGTAYDAAAPYVGLPRMTPAFRNFLYGTADADIPQPGTRLMNTIMAANPEADRPGSVPVTTPAERIARAGAAGAVAGTMLPNPLLGPLSGAAGAVTGEEAGRMAPEWAQPGVQLLGNVLGGGIVLGAPAAYNALKPGLARLSEGGIQLPPGVSPLSPEAAAFYDAQRAARRGGGTPPQPPTEPPSGAATPPEGPSPGMGGGGAAQPTQAAGAAVSPAAVVGMTPEEVAIYRTTAEGNKLLEPQAVGVPDRNQYVRGVNPTLAEQEQSVNTARELKAAGIADTAVSQEARLVAEEHNEARGQHWDEMSGVPNDIRNRELTQERDIQRAKPEVFKDAGQPGHEVVLDPITTKIRDTLAVPENLESPAVQEAMGYVLNRLVDENGNPRITNPRQLWGLRQQIDKMTSKRMASEDSKLHYAAGQLSELKPIIDAQIEKVSPGFGDMLKTYSEHARRIEEMRLLQGIKNDIYVGSGGRMRMSFDKLQNAMKRIVDMRDPTQTFEQNPYNSISEANMRKLWDLRDDLRRSASALELARAAGSDTVPNILDMFKGMAKGPEGLAALHGAAALISPGYGNVAVHFGKRLVEPFLDARRAAQTRQQGMEMLRPPINQLRDPNAP